jgi:hypothetical protein
MGEGVTGKFELDIRTSSQGSYRPASTTSINSAR